VRFLELLWFSAYAELKAESARSYLGFLWWLLEPAMFMAVFYVVFGLVLNNGGPDYIPFLLIGLTFWQWFKSCVSHGGHAIWLNIPLMRQVKLPVLLFPLSAVLSDTVKFLFIFVVLLLILWVSGYGPWWGYLALPLVFGVELLLAAAFALIAAAIVPFVPDVRFVIENALMALMFVSGVVFAFDGLPDPYRSWMALNPMVGILESARDILMRGQWPDWQLLLQAGIGSLVILTIAVIMITQLAPRYPKLAV
jgi:lipopolysaccharide transport system permease protein